MSDGFLMKLISWLFCQICRNVVKFGCMMREGRYCDDSRKHVQNSSSSILSAELLVHQRGVQFCNLILGKKREKKLQHNSYHFVHIYMWIGRTFLISNFKILISILNFQVIEMTIVLET